MSKVAIKKIKGIKLKKKSKYGFVKKTFSFSFRIVLILTGFCLLISYLSIFINPSKFSIPSFFGLYFIPFVFVNLFLLFIAAIKRSKSFWIPLVLLIPSIFFYDLFYKFTNNSNENAKGIELKICSYNLGAFAKDKGVSTSNCVLKVSKFISEEDPDIVCFQEYHCQDTSVISKVFPNYPYRQSHFFRLKNKSFFGNIILSKYNIEQKGVLNFKNTYTNLSIFADIKVNNSTIRVYNNHLESNNLSLTAILEKISYRKNDVKELRAQLINAHDKMLISYRKRAVQVDSIISKINSSPNLAIICGDMNDTPMSYTYHTLKKNRKDSFVAAGKGFSATYSVLWPLLRIDYIFYPSNFVCLEHKTPRVKFSDHYPIISKIIIPNIN